MGAATATGRSRTMRAVVFVLLTIAILMALTFTLDRRSQPPSDLFSTTVIDVGGVAPSG